MTRFPGFSKIPDVVHQTWRSADKPPWVVSNRASWQDRHTGFEFRFYDDDGSRGFVADRFPELLELYDRLRLPVERADLFRYLVLHDQGGVYADIDTVAVGSVVGLWGADTELGLVEEGPSLLLNRRECEDHGWAEYYEAQRPVQYAQYLMAATPGHPALAEVIRRIAEHTAHLDEGSRPRGYTTIERTGPGVWTDAVNATGCSGPKVSVVDPATASSAVVHQYRGTWK